MAALLPPDVTASLHPAPCGDGGSVSKASRFERRCFGLAQPSRYALLIRALVAAAVAFLAASQSANAEEHEPDQLGEELHAAAGGTAARGRSSRALLAPSTPDCSRNGTGFFKDASGQCLSMPYECRNGGYSIVEGPRSGACHCPIGPDSSHLTQGGDCSACAYNRDPTTNCTTALNLCESYRTEALSPLTVTHSQNQTSWAYCRAKAAIARSAVQLQCSPVFSTSPTSFDCVCPGGYQLTNGRCIDVDECGGSFPPCAYLPTTRQLKRPGSPFNTTLYPAYGAICVNLQGGYNCSCPPCYFPASLDKNWVVSACDPIPGCSLTQPVALQPFRVRADGSAVAADGSRPSSISPNPKPKST